MKKHLNGLLGSHLGSGPNPIFTKNDILLNNLCESFNNLILDARDKQIITMLERIRCILMNMIRVNKTKMQKKDGSFVS